MNCPADSNSAWLSILVFALTCLTALYPAWKAATLEPVRAIRGSLHERARPSTAGTAHHWPVFVLIAARSIWRNPRRTAITVGGTAFAIVAFVFLFGVFDGFGEQIIDNSTRYLTGHLQIERPGFRRDYGPSRAIGDGAAPLARLQGAPNVAGIAPRIQAQVLVASARRSEGVLLVGIDPALEPQVTFIDRTVVAGAPLATGDDRVIMVGRELAAALGLQLGEKTVVTAQAADGQLGTAAYRIGGIFATESSAFDRGIAFVTLPAAQALLSRPGQISTVNVRLQDRRRLDETAQDLQRRLNDPGLTLVRWQTLLPQVDQMVRLTRVLGDVVLGIALVVVAMAVMNTALMAASERRREFGVLMALGTRPSAVLRMVIYETLVLMLIASAIGHGLGIALVKATGARGLDLSFLFGGLATIPGLTGVIRPYLLVEHIVVPALALIAIGVLASLYPAASAARLDPVRAIRHA